MATVTLDQRVSSLETEFRTELRHLATKADLTELRVEVQAIENRLTLRLGGLMVAGLAAVAAIMRFLA